jgi:flagellar hook-associated protein 3 FlgL
MRVTTADFFTRNLASMQRSESLVAQVQQQLGSGLKLQNPADDPAGAASVSRFNAALAAGASYDTTVQHANAALAAEEGALSSATDVLQRARELAVQGLSAGQSQQSRAGLATEVQALRSQLLSLANGVGANGEHLFGGYSVGAPPFTETAGVVSFVGDAGQRRLEVGPGNSIAVADAGSTVFAGARAGNGSFVTTTAAANAGSLLVGSTSVVGSFVPDDYTVAFSVDAAGAITYTVTGATSGSVTSGSYSPGDTLSFNGVSLATSGTPANGDVVTVSPAGHQDAFSVLGDVAAALGLPDGTPQQRAEQANRLTRALESLDQQMGQVSSVRADVGARMKAADVASDANAGAKLQIQQALSDVQDLDYAEASTRLAKHLTALQAVQETFSRLSNLSLFNYLR